MGKRFVGLDGLKHFWIKAKTWITGQITSEVTAKIAEIVANAPEDLDTLKEIADWIKTHANDASAMNTQITTNKNDIATLKTSVAGKADKSHTHTKSQITDFPTSLKNPNALTINGKTYDGSSAVNAGVQTVANGGTGATTAKGAEYNIIGGVETVETTPTDDRYMALRNLTINSENGSFKWTKCSSIWSWIQSKISSVLGLTATNYGGKASTAGTADKATNDGNGNNIVNTYALKYNLQYTKSINIKKSNGSSDTYYYLIAKTLSSDSTLNTDTLFVNGSDYKNRMFEGSITTRAGNYVYNYGKNNLPIELYQQTDGTIYVYWLVSDAYNKVVLNISATMSITIYGGNLSAVTPTGSKMTLNEYDYKSYAVLPVGRGGTGQTTANDAANSFINSLTTSDSVPVDNDYFISQYVNGGTNSTTYHRRPVSKLWEYIKGKISSVLGLKENTIATLRTAADAGFLCKQYQLASATSDSITQTYNVILLGKIPDPASTEAPATPSESWDIDVDFYFVRSQGHKASWCNVKAGYGYSNAWRKYGLIETFGVDSNSNHSKPFYLITVKYNNEYYIAVRHMVDIDGSYAARVKNVNTKGSRNPATVNNTPLANMLKVIPYQKTTDGTILNSEVKSSIADFPNTYAPAVERNGDLLLKSGYVRIGTSGVAGSKLTIQGGTVNSNSYPDTNPKLEFKNNDGSQNISLTFTDYDSVQAPASLTLNGNQGNEYFIAPNIKATTNFIGNLTGNVTGNISGSSGSCTGNSATATSADKATSDANGNNIADTYATKDELTNAVPTYSASDAGKVLAVNSDGTGTQWVKL